MRRKPLSPPPKNASGIRARNKGRQLRSVLTENGRVKLKRVRWTMPGEGSHTPMDALLDKSEKSFTRGIREMLCRLNQSSSSFAKTAKNIGRLASIDISGESVRQLVEQQGRELTKQLTGGQIDIGWSAAECTMGDTSSDTDAIGTEASPTRPSGQASPDSTRVYVGCDGVKVPVITQTEKLKRRATIKLKRRRCGKKCRPLPALRKGSDQQYKEARVVVAYDESQTRRIVVATRGDSEATGRLLRTVSKAIKLDEASESIANIDGAAWIRNQLEFHGIVKDINLDYYHLKDNMQKARREMFGEAEAGSAWLEQLMNVLMERDVDALLSNLVGQQLTYTGRKRQALEQLIGYISARRDIIRYRELRARRCQIGSGPTEAQCKTTTQRVKGRGRRWDFVNAESMMNLAAIEASNLWDDYWENQAKTAA